MKKIVLLMLLVCCLTMSSCANFYYPDERGLESFSPNQSEFDLCHRLIPDQFIDKFDYIDGNYYNAVDSTFFTVGYREKTLVYLQYAEQNYYDAKLYAIQDLILSEEPIEEYNGYTFFLNKSLLKEFDSHHLDGSNYPHKFIMFAYNDEKMTLVFFGFYVSMELYNEVDAVADDWPAFLEKYYGEWYSFS